MLTVFLYEGDDEYEIEVDYRFSAPEPDIGYCGALDEWSVRRMTLNGVPIDTIAFTDAQQLSITQQIIEGAW